MCLAQGPQRSNAGEARTRGPSVSSKSEMVTLERSHRFCIKRMQSLGMQTRTDAALSLMGIFPLQTEIDFRKLTLFGHLCRTNT